MLTKTVLKNGASPPIVFLHGFLGKAEDWLGVCAHLPERLCIGYDLPGHGKTPFGVEVAIDEPECHLVGYSMGGRLALQYLQRHALSLTLLSVHPGLKSEGEKKARMQSDEAWARVLRETPIDTFLKKWYNQPIFQPYKPDFATRREQNVEGLAQTLVAFSLAKQKRFEIDGVLVGVRDIKFRALYEHPVVIPNAGHMIHLENPRAVAEIIRAKL